MEQSSDSTRIEILMAIHQPCPVFLEKQINSILGQTYRNWGMTLVVDGRHDDLLEELESWRKRHPRIAVNVVSDHGGCCRTFEKGLVTLKGRDCLVALADQDDVWHPEKLERLAAVFQRQPDTLMAFCDSSIINDRDTVISPSLHGTEQRVPGFSLSSLMARNSISGHSQLFRSTLLDDAVPFPEGLCKTGLNHDHWLSMVAAWKGRIHFLDEVLVQHRLHGKNQIGPRMRRKGSAQTGSSAWMNQNRHLRRVLGVRHRLLCSLPGFSVCGGSGFGRPTMLCWCLKALFDRNSPAAAIYLRACLAGAPKSDKLPACR